jgi:transcriptional regulator with PAS, ATPase and Fis domain
MGNGSIQRREPLPPSTTQSARRLLTAHAARTDTTVLIEGESGTGKELVARSIHRYSRRAARPFTAINCSALTETLLQSELFGYAKGSFTGANADRTGLFESTQGGTILLDELGTTGASLRLPCCASCRRRRCGASASARRAGWRCA